MKKTVFTGDRPTGQLHLGHYLGSLQNRVKLQNSGAKVKILIADTQVLNNDISKSKNVKENILNLMRDYMFIGLDPEKTSFLLQSQISELFELGMYFSNLVTQEQLLRIPTIKSEREMYQENGTMNMGFLTYPIFQTADIVMFSPDVVPVGEDQVPVLEFGNDIIRKFNNSFGNDLLKKIVPVISETPRLIGIDGQHKMSKSLDNAIFLRDSKDEIKRKCMKMFTDPNHIRVSDPGKVEGNIVFMFLDIFHQDKNKLESLKNHYTKGGLGDVVLKKMLIDDISQYLEKFQNNKKYSDSDLLEILSDGTSKAKKEASEKMKVLRSYIFK